MDSSLIIPAVVAGVVVFATIAVIIGRSKQKPIGMDPDNWQPFTCKSICTDTESRQTVLC
jgi:hypothetical protein